MTSCANPSEQAPALTHDSQPTWLTSFIPPYFLKGGHAQTLVGNYWPRPPLTLPTESTPVLVDPDDSSRVLCLCHWQPEAVRKDQLTILLVHGLEGSSDSRYIQGITALAWQADCNIIRMNMRNCGGTETWTPTLYHSGLSADIAAVLYHFVNLHSLSRVTIAGYSMGGNLVLKLAGELANQTPKWLLAAVAVSPAADLAPSADALHNPENRIYERHFLRNLMRRFHHKAQLFPAIYPIAGVGPVRSIREFDDKITARFSGFTGADDYYYRSSAARVVSQITIPTLILHALDDPFIRLTTETRNKLTANSAIHLVETAHGGHCAFLAETHTTPQGKSPRHWAESTLIRYLLQTVGHANGS